MSKIYGVTVGTPLNPDKLGGGGSGDGCGITVVDELDVEKEYGEKEVPSMNAFTGALMTLVDEFASKSDFEMAEASVSDLVSELAEHKTTSNRKINDIESKANLLESLLDTMSQNVAFKQDKLTSGTNIKTINGESILGLGDLSVGGSTEEEWEHICDISVVEDTENPLFKITQSLGADYKKLHIVVNKNTAGGLVATSSDSYPLRIYGNSQHNNNLIAQFGAGVTSKGYVWYSCEIDYNKYTNLITGWSSICADNHWKTINSQIQKPIHTLVFVNTVKSDATAGFRTFTIKVWGVRA